MEMFARMPSFSGAHCPQRRARALSGHSAAWAIDKLTTLIGAVLSPRLGKGGRQRDESKIAANQAIVFIAVNLAG